MNDLQKQTEDYQHSYIIKWLLILAIVFTIIFGSILNGYSQTKEEVYNYCIEIGIQHPGIVLAQSRLETGNFTSSMCKVNNNLFGMKEAKQRRTTALGTRNKHAYYSNWKQSVYDYLLWQNKYYKGGDYYEFLLSVGYATDKEYLNKLKQF